VSKLIRLSKTGIEYSDYRVNGGRLMKRLGHTGIEYAINPDGSRGYAWNFISGCGNNIDGLCKDGGFNCWAYSITQRFKDRYPHGFNPTVYPEALLRPLHLKKPSRILCAFMGDLFGDWFAPHDMIHIEGMPKGYTLKSWVFSVINQCPQHTFIFLTKQPQNLIKWSPFPSNCQVGQTITQCLDGIGYMADVEAKVKFISFEPLLFYNVDPLTAASLFKANGIKWVAIGALTGTYRELLEIHPKLTPMPYGNKWTLQPPVEWLREIETAARIVGIPIYEKNNLRPLLGDNLCREMP